MRGALQRGEGAAELLHAAFLAADADISAEEGCTATAVLMWRGEGGDVCLQVGGMVGRRLGGVACRLRRERRPVMGQGV